MFVIAVTGGLGAGKSTAADYLASRGAVVIALDEVAKRALQESPAVRSRVVERFGDAVLGDDGRVDRRALAAAAFGDAQAATDLNAIVHPAAIDETRRALAQLAERDDPPLVVLEIPLLAEAPALLDDADMVIAVEAPDDVRVARAVARGMREADARARIARQATDEQRAAIADAVIVNDGDENGLRRALERIFEESVVPAMDREL